MFSFNSTVRFSECDETSTLALVPLINYLQDCSTFQAEALGVGIQFQRERGFAWAITTWHIEIKDLPKFGDPIRIETCCYEMKRSHAMRNYAIRRPDGSPLVMADAEYVVFNRASSKIMRVPESELIYLEDEPRLEMGLLERKIALPGDYVEADSMVVSRQHIDYNDHVNNAQYVLMALEAASSFAVIGAPTSIDVQYRKMAFLGDTVVPFVLVDGMRACVKLCAPDGSTYSIVRFNFR